VPQRKKSAKRYDTPRNLAQLRFVATNPRDHSERNVAMIQTAIATVGAARSIVIDEGAEVLAGEAVVQAARAAGLRKLLVIDADGRTLVAVRRRGLTAADKVKLALFDNRAGELAMWKPDALHELLDAGFDLQPYWTADELDAVLADAGDTEGLTDPDAIPTPRTTSIRRGELFELGRHRLLCGDSTKAADVQRVLTRVRPALMVTDPPYGVEYDPTWRVRAGVNQNRKKLGAVANDDRCDWTEVWRLFPGAVAYIWHAALKSSTVAASLTTAGFSLRSQIIWAKDRLVLSRGDYHWQHEPAWYAVRKGRTGHWSGARDQTTVWAIPHRKSESGHGTEKPVDCMKRPIENNSSPGQAIYEPFCGSGTTIIAAEQTGRRCYAMEIDPRYVAVAIKRWEDFTGKTSERIDG
jgi:DNA modification methylase